EKRPIVSQSLLKRSDEFSYRGCSDGGNPHAFGQLGPLKVGVRQAEHVVGVFAHLGYADISHFLMKDGVTPVREDDGQALEAFAGLSPKCLKGVHAAAICLKGNHLALGTGHCSADGQWQTDTDCATRELQVVVRGSSKAVVEETATLGQAFVGDNCIIGKQRRDSP